MRIVTWNCCRRSYANAMEALEPVKADLVFLQEVGRPTTLDVSVAWAGTNPKQGVLVAAAGTFELQRSKSSAAKYRVVAVKGPSSFVALNVWAQPKPAPRYVGHINRTLTRLRRLLADRPCVIAGDFNSEGPEQAGRESNHTRLVERLRDEFGIVSAYHHRHRVEHGQETHVTYYHRPLRNQPWHIDFCFIPQEWAEKIRDVEVLDHEPWSRLSDHRPIVVDIDL